MKSYFDLNPIIWNIIHKKLDENKINPTIVDVGARNGMFLLHKEYCRISDLIGFEPNKVEYEKLIKNNTDAKKIFVEPNFQSKKYFNYALWKKKCKKNFFITKGPGASTLMGESEKNTSEMFIINAKNSYKDDHTAISKVQKIDCNKLDNVPSIKIIDFLKLDTEGSELSILEGAYNLLKKKKILMIKCEFVFFKYYKEHKIFGDIHSFLDSLGYRLLAIDLDQPKYSPLKNGIPAPNDKGLNYAGDAYFCIDFSKNKIRNEESLRLGAISLSLGFNNLGLFFLHNSQDFTNKELEIVTNSLSKVSILRKFTDYWKKLPSIIYNLIKK